MQSFSRGTNQLPQANALQRGPYQVRCRLKAGETTSVPHAVYEIDSYDEDAHEYIVVRPTEDSLPQARLILSGGHAVAAEAAFMGSQSTDALNAAADTGQTVAVGDDIGTQTDSYLLKVDNTGFKALNYDTTEGLCLVRPFSSGGGVQYFDLLTTPGYIGDILGRVFFTAPVSTLSGTAYSTETTLEDSFDYTSQAGDVLIIPFSQLNVLVGACSNGSVLAYIEIYNSTIASWVTISQDVRCGFSGSTSLATNITGGLPTNRPVEGVVPSDGIYTKVRARFLYTINGATGSGPRTLTMSINSSQAWVNSYLFRIIRGVDLTP